MKLALVIETASNTVIQKMINCTVLTKFTNVQKPLEGFSNTACNLGFLFSPSDLLLSIPVSILNH